MRNNRRRDSARGSSPDGPDLEEHGDTWLRWAARIGYVARGVVYVAIGTIAVAVAVGLAERPGGAHRAMLLIERQPLGKLVLAALAVGLFGYAALNLAGAFNDPEGHGRSARGLLTRGADAFTGALYIALAVGAVRIIAAPSQGGGRIVEGWASGVLLLPGGVVILGAIGLSLVGAGGFLVYRARTEAFEKELDRRTLSAVAWQLLVAAARFGTLVRGVVLGISGILVIEAAATGQSERVGGIGDALSAVETTLLGAWLLGAAGLGFTAYGVYQLAKVRNRRVPIQSSRFTVPPPQWSDR